MTRFSSPVKKILAILVFLMTIIFLHITTVKNRGFSFANYTMLRRSHFESPSNADRSISDIKEVSKHSSNQTKPAKNIHLHPNQATSSSVYSELISSVNLENINTTAEIEESSSLLYPEEHPKLTKLNLNHRLQQQRIKENIKRVCTARNISNRQHLSDLPKDFRFKANVIDQYKFIYVTVPKAASSSIKHYIMRLLEDKRQLNQIHIFFTRYSLEGRLKRSNDTENEIRDYFRFLIIRNPLSRAISGFHNKFGTLKNSLQYHYGILFRNALKLNGLPKDTNRTLTFDEFLIWLTKAYAIEAHFRPSSSFTYPCLYEYDYIGTTETLADDIENLKLILNFPDIEIDPAYSVRKKIENDKENIILPKDSDNMYVESLKNKQLLDDFYTKFKEDYEFFQYTKLGDKGYPKSKFFLS